MTKNYLDAQILVITLLVLTILAITIIGVVIIINRDTNQVVTNRKYEEIYGVTENTLREMVSRFGDGSVPISEIELDAEYGNFCGTGAGAGTDLEVECDISSAFSATQSILPVSTEVTVRDIRRLENYELPKDDVIDLDLNQYSNSLDFYWEGAAAIELLLIYENVSSGELFSISDVYNGANVLDSPVMQTVNDHPGPMAAGISSSVSGNVGNSFTLNIGSLLGAGENALTLSIIPRMRSGESIVLNVDPSNEGAFAYQIRQFIGTSVEDSTITNVTESPTITIETSVSLVPRLDSIWNYTLLTNSVNF